MTIKEIIKAHEVKQPEPKELPLTIDEETLHLIEWVEDLEARCAR